MLKMLVVLQLRWDGYEMVFVTVTDDLVGKTQGLCGTYDGDQTNDFTTDSGTVVSEPASFVTSWKRTFAGGGHLVLIAFCILFAITYR